MTLHEQKFSLASYMNQFHHEANEQDEKAMSDIPVHYSGYSNLIAQMRAFLASYEGREADGKQRFSEVLHRAILGYAEDRARLLALINDQLIKKRIHDMPPPHAQYKTLAEAVCAEIIGLSVLELVLKNREGLEEIQVVGKQVFEVRDGMATLSPYAFKSIEEVERIQQNLLLFNHDTMSPRKKWSEAMMSDGSRVTLTGFGFTGEPTITIRFYTLDRFDLASFSEPRLGTMDEAMVLLVRALIRAYYNLVIIGATNSGKTSLLKALVNEMPTDERIITIESRHELMLKRDFPLRNIIEYEVDEADEHHSSALAFKLALRQSPKRIVHAEIRDEDANVYVRACTRGHDGSMTTLHASALEDVPETIADMCMLDQRGMNDERMTKRITQYVSQFGLHMAIVKGQRKLVRVVEYSYTDKGVVLRDIATYDYGLERWVYPQPLSAQASAKIALHDHALYEQLCERGIATR